MKHHGLAEPRGQAACHHDDSSDDRYFDFDEGRFGRLFPDLAPAYLDPSLLHELGRKDGPMQGPKTSVPSKTVTLGFVFLGQFIDHDITLDVTSSLDRRNDPEATRNFRTPALDLDCVYGGGPEATPYFYDAGAAAPLADKVLRLGKKGFDLPRVGKKALIGDPRNDENRVVSQLQLAFLKFHNAVAAHLAAEAPEGELFEEAQRTVRWHYQWILLREFLPRMIGQAMTDEILCRGRQWYHFARRPFIPVEFSVAAYRYGHSMVTNRLGINATHSNVELFSDALGHGFTPVEDAEGVVDWSRLFDTKKGSVQFAAKLDSKLAPELLDLPFVQNGESSLATRNLLRGQAFGLPSGQAVAETMGQTPLTAKQLGLKGSLGTCTPLWFYILKEAELLGTREGEGGERLGPVGGRIVGEVLVGLMQGDPSSMLAAEPTWQPTLPRRNGKTEGPYTIGDLLHFAGVA